jgi:hypothetical protein
MAKPAIPSSVELPDRPGKVILPRLRIGPFPCGAIDEDFESHSVPRWPKTKRGQLVAGADHDFRKA